MMEAVALTLVDIPITFIIILVFSVVVYFLTGLQRTAAPFLYVVSYSFKSEGIILMNGLFVSLDSIFFLFVFTSAISMKAWFRAVAAAFESEATASSFAGLFLLLLVLYTYVSSLVFFCSQDYLY